MNQIFGTANNWTPAGVPSVSDNLTVGLPAANVVLTADGIANNLVINGGGSISTSGFSLAIRIDTSLTGLGTELTVSPGSTVDFNTNHLDVLSGAGVFMSGGLAAIDDVITIGSGSMLSGQGTLRLTSGNSLEGLVNEGAIRANGAATQILTIDRTGAATFDLDGSLETGTIGFDTIKTDFTIDAPLRDAYDPLLNIGPGNVLRFVQGATLSGGVIMNGTTSGGDAILGADIGSTIHHQGPLNVTGFGAQLLGAHVIEAGTQVLFAAGTQAVFGEVEFQGGGAFGSGLLTYNDELRVTANTTTSIDVFDLDGNLNNGQVTIDNAALFIGASHIDVSGSDSFDSEMSISNGALAVSTASNGWTMNGTLNLFQVGAGTNSIFGETVTVTGDVVLTGGRSDFTTGPIFESSAQVTFANPSTLGLRDATRTDDFRRRNRPTLRNDGDRSANGDSVDHQRFRQHGNYRRHHLDRFALGHGPHLRDQQR